MTPEQIIAEYDKLVERAVTVVRSEPYDVYLDDDAASHARISTSAETATLHWQEMEGWQDPTLEERERSFPASLLTLSTEDYCAWRQAETERVETLRAEAAKKERAAMEAMQEANERTLLARLKAKYEGAQ